MVKTAYIGCRENPLTIECSNSRFLSMGNKVKEMNIERLDYGFTAKALSIVVSLHSNPHFGASIANPTKVRLFHIKR